MEKDRDQGVNIIATNDQIGRASGQLQPAVDSRPTCPIIVRAENAAPVSSQKDGVAFHGQRLDRESASISIFNAADSRPALSIIRRAKQAALPGGGENRILIDCDRGDTC